MKNASFLLTLLLCVALVGCAAQGDSINGNNDEGPSTASAPPLELTTELCDDPTNMTVLLESPTANELFASGQFNEDQVERMIAAPTEGPFYMFNLIRYREHALYADGRDTDLTGREANALYAPLEFLTAIGAGIVFNTEVDEQIDGEDFIWETVAVVEYPCPVAFFAMLAHPEFQSRAIHKDAGVEKTIVMVADLAPTQAPQGVEPPESPYPATEDDPAFELIHVQDFHEIAQYEQGADEPERSGQEAWELYVANGAEAGQAIGSYPTARLVVQGVFQGDDRTWDEINIIHMPSRAGFRALLDDETRQAGRYHRTAALEHNYSLITLPSMIDFPGSSGGEASPLEVTEDGTGTICETDADCPGDGVDSCLSEGGAGFCTRVGCDAGECQGSYVCCRSCAEVVAAQLPFDGSACLPPYVVDSLTAAPASCTCD